MGRWLGAAAWCVAAMACGGDPTGEGSGGSGSGSGSGSSAGTTTASTSAGTTAGTSASTTMADSSGGASTQAGSSSGGDTEIGMPKGEVRFVALGDAGEGNEAQFAVGQTIATVCEERGCDFALYLGDNFYDVGVDSSMDMQFETKFEQPYAPIDFPFHITLGNHDYGLLGNDWSRSQAQIDYSSKSDKWSLPAEYYGFQVEHVHFISLDTSQLFWSQDLEAQRTFLRAELAAASEGWTIAFGHHPYISNGDHGNAGNYEGLGGLIGGDAVQEFFEAEVCGKVHVYLSGHDHSRQWLVSQCGTEFIVSGAGAKLTELPHRDDNPTHWEDVATPGFFWVEIVDDSFTGVFFDRDGNAQYERTITL
jgi:tartrate-resistant acid phosphatase type 5